jgi:hypothetical protein
MAKGDLAKLDAAHRATGAQGLFSLDWTEPRPGASAQGLCPSPIPRFSNSTACLTIRGDVDAHWRATPRQDVNVILIPVLYISLVIIYTKYTGWYQNDFNVHRRATLEALAPWRANGTVAGIFLGDEQCYHGVSLQNLTVVTALIRRDWPEAVLYINEAQVRKTAELTFSATIQPP